MGYEFKGKSESFENQPMLERVKARISRIEEGRDLIALLDQYNIEVLFDRQIPFAGACACSLNYKNTINGLPSISHMYVLINPTLLGDDEDVMVGVLLHEMWHVKQKLYGYIVPTQSTLVEDACFLKVLLEADAESFALDICYKLMLKDDAAIWEKHKDVFGVKEVYQKSVETNDCDVLSNGAARRQTFNACFLNKRFKEAYHELAIDQWKKIVMMPDNNTYKEMNLEHLKKIGTLSKVDYLKNVPMERAFPYRKINSKNKLLIEQAKVEILRNKKAVNNNKPVGPKNGR